MILRNDENEIILNTEDLLLYDVIASIEAKQVVTISGKEMTVKEFREMKNNDPNKGRWGRKVRNEMDDELI